MVIKGVIYQRRGIDHEDSRRAISTAFNGDFGDFVAKQVKFYRIHEDSNLAGHYHEYKELFCVVEGRMDFLLEDIQTKEKETYSLSENDVLLIPQRVAHKVTVKKGTLIIGCSEKPFISSEINDHQYDF